MKYEFIPQGVCSRKIIIDVEGDIIKSVEFEGGCAGNTKGISKLVENMNVKDVIERLKGIPCGMKPTSCPDQLARALEKVVNEG